MFSGPMDVGLHLITPQQGAEHAVFALPSYSFFKLSIVGSGTKGKGRICKVREY